MITGGLGAAHAYFTFAHGNRDSLALNALLWAGLYALAIHGLDSVAASGAHGPANAGDMHNHPRVARTWWVAPSSTSGTRPCCGVSLAPSSSSAVIPRLTLRGFSTDIS